MCPIDSWLYKSIYFNSYLSEKVLSQDPVLIIVCPTFLKLHLNIGSIQQYPDQYSSLYRDGVFLQSLEDGLSHDADIFALQIRIEECDLDNDRLDQDV